MTMARHRILLYNPDAVFYTMPLGLLAVGSSLDTDKYEVDIIDARLESDPLDVVLTRADGALCLGMTVLTGQPIKDALRISQAVKVRHPNLPIVWGGWHPSLFQADCLEEKSVDITITGQGEETFAEVVERLASHDSLEGCEGTAFRQNGTITVNPPRPLRKVDSFPEHNYGLIPVERYFVLKGRRQLDYISSQGCRFRCEFCADPFVYKRGWVGLSPNRMGREITMLAAQHHIEEVSFQDETFFTSAKRVAAISEAFISADLNISWTATMRADQGDRMDDALLSGARRSGLRRVMIGVESGSQEMLDWMKKDIKIEQVFISAEKCIRHDIGATFPFIVGFPGETEESIAATMRLVKELRRLSPLFEAQIFFYRPYPGTPIALEAERTGYRMPRTLEEWVDFDYVGTDGSDNLWLNRTQRRMVQRFKFYQRHAFGIHPHILHQPLQWMSRLRCRTDFYRLPFEKTCVEWLRPPAQLS